VHCRTLYRNLSASLKVPTALLVDSLRDVASSLSLHRCLALNRNEGTCSMSS
jgi:hypothetical protein